MVDQKTENASKATWPVGIWDVELGHAPLPFLLSTQVSPNVASDLGTYDEVDYQIKIESLAPNAGFRVIGPP